MDYKYIESLLLSAKSGDIPSIEKLTEEFTPLIKSLCSKTHLSNHTKEDLENECYLSLITAIKKYNPESHRFVAYATNAIKNNLNYLIRKNLVHKEITSQASLTPTGSLDYLNLSTGENIDDSILNSHTKRIILDAVQALTYEEKELFIYVQVRKNTLKSYAALKGMSCSTASKRKFATLKKISQYIEANN